MVRLATTTQVIDFLGGTTVVARLTKRTLQAVSNWRRDDRAKFPKETFLVIGHALSEREAWAPSDLWGISEVPVSGRTADEGAEGTR